MQWCQLKGLRAGVWLSDGALDSSAGGSPFPPRALPVNKTKEGGWSLAGGLEACPTSGTMTVSHRRLDSEGKAPNSNIQGRIKAHYEVPLDPGAISQWWQELCSLGDLLKGSYRGNEAGVHRGGVTIGTYISEAFIQHIQKGKASHQGYPVFITSGHREPEPQDKPQEKKTQLKLRDSSLPHLLSLRVPPEAPL